MYGLTTITGLIRFERRTRGLAAVALGAFIFLSAFAIEARAQNTYGGATVVHAGSIGLVPGQRVSVTAPNFYFQNGRVRFLKHSIKVYEIGSHGITERTSNLIYSGESGGLNEFGHEYGHIFTLNHGDLRVPGDPSTGRVEVRIEVESFPPPETQERAVGPSAVVLSPTIELIEDQNGKTVLFGLLLLESQGTSTNDDSGLQLEMSKTLRMGLNVLLASGQTVRIRIEAADAADSSPIVVWNWSYDEDGTYNGDNGAVGAEVRIRAFSGSTGALLWRRELTSLTEGLNTIDINRDELTEAVEPETGRFELWIEVVILQGPIRSGQMDEVIVVGVNNNANRIWEK